MRVFVSTVQGLRLFWCLFCFSSGVGLVPRRVRLPLVNVGTWAERFKK
jgi:hypothetical protein